MKGAPPYGLKYQGMKTAWVNNNIQCMNCGLPGHATSLCLYCHKCLTFHQKTKARLNQCELYMKKKREAERAVMSAKAQAQAARRRVARFPPRAVARAVARSAQRPQAPGRSRPPPARVRGAWGAGMPTASQPPAPALAAEIAKLRLGLEKVATLQQQEMKEIKEAVMNNSASISRIRRAGGSRAATLSAPAPAQVPGAGTTRAAAAAPVAAAATQVTATAAGAANQGAQVAIPRQEDPLAHADEVCLSVFSFPLEDVTAGLWHLGLEDERGTTFVFLRIFWAMASRRCLHSLIKAKRAEAFAPVDGDLIKVVVATGGAVVDIPDSDDCSGDLASAARAELLQFMAQLGRLSITEAELASLLARLARREVVAAGGGDAEAALNNLASQVDRKYGFAVHAKRAYLAAPTRVG